MSLKMPKVGSVIEAVKSPDIPKVVAGKAAGKVTTQTAKNIITTGSLKSAVLGTLKSPKTYQNIGKGLAVETLPSLIGGSTPEGSANWGRPAIGENGWLINTDSWFQKKPKKQLGTR